MKLNSFLIASFIVMYINGPKKKSVHVSKNSVKIGF
jgi:hypothetical protein